MIDLLGQLDELANEMYDALIHNDASRVASLAILQETCLAQIKQEFDANPELRVQAAERLRKIQELMRLNQKLIQNAMELTNGVIQETYRRNNISYSSNA